MTYHLLLVISVSFGILSAEGFLNHYPKLNLRGKIDSDCGDPLFLTKYIESGNITEGRRLARVPFTENFNITSFAGFFTVNQTYNSNQFFWYFPAIFNAKEAPVILWLQGGPGSSSLYGLFSENGPLRVKNNTLEKRELHWALEHHVIYIDNPVGAGFSFTNENAGYCTDQTQIGEQLYSSIVQFFQIFPELQSNNFFAAGEAYGGKYVSALAYTIHKNNPTAALKINLKGLAIGNGWIDPENQLMNGEYFYQLGLFDWNDKKQFDKVEHDAKEALEQQHFLKAYEYFHELRGMVMENSGLFNLNNYIEPDDDNDDFGPIVTSSDIRKGIHVGDLSFNDGRLVYNYLIPEYMQSMAPIISELLDHYNILTYNGQLDIIVAYPFTVNYLRHLNFTGSEEYETAERYFWWIEEEVAGYVKTAGRLVEAMVRNAGRMVPKDQPLWAFDLITRFTHDKPFYNHE